MLRKYVKLFPEYKYLTESPIRRKYNTDILEKLILCRGCTVQYAEDWEVNNMIRDSEVWITSSGESFYQ